MGVPASFKWSPSELESLNTLNDEDKRQFLKKNEINIRQCLGEAVPTPLFRAVAKNIAHHLQTTVPSLNKIKRLVEKEQLANIDNLLAYLREHKLSFPTTSKIAELANSKRLDEAAYYTRQDLCFSLVAALPDFKNKKQLRILEPSVGVGNFLPVLFTKYQGVPEVKLDVLDINPDSLRLLKQTIKCLKIPSNFEIRFINDDFLTHEFRKNYDIVVGNPPFGKLAASQLKNYQSRGLTSRLDTRNLFALFFERALSLAPIVALFTPKSLLNAPEFNSLRELLETKSVRHINDYGEKGFSGVKIETISLVVDAKSPPARTTVNSFVLNSYKTYDQTYVMDHNYPYWLIYRNAYFDKLAEKLNMGIFDVLRDRTLTSKAMNNRGKVRVIKSRNITNGAIQPRSEDQFVDDPHVSPIARHYYSQENIVVAPNLSYYPRAALLPKDTIVDGSAAILRPKHNVVVTQNDLAFFSSKEFFLFYRIARNYSTRSLNIDSKSVYFWALPQKTIRHELMPEQNRANFLFALPATFAADTV